MPPYRNVMDSLGLDRRAPGMRACILTRLSVESLLPQARMQPARPEAACCSLHYLDLATTTISCISILGCIP